MIALGSLLVLAAATTLPATFPQPAGLAPNVRFWEAVYGTYRSDQVVIHDRRRLDVVYHVIDLGSLRPFPEAPSARERRERRRAREARVEAEMDAVRDALAALRRARAAGRPPPKGLASRIAARIEAAHAEALLEGAEAHLRWQYGLADRFAGGLIRFEAWEPAVRAELERAGVPGDLVALAFVESLFDPRVRSFVGAAGIFQLMPATARELGLRRGRGFDERRDPVLATRAAARMLRRNYQRLGSWPLALTGYNHGPNGVARAIRKVGSRDLEDLIARYRSPSWGFASQNFYAEFLAARNVLARRAHYFGPWVHAPPLRFRGLTLKHAARLRDVLPRSCQRPVLRQDLARLNPALDGAALASRVRLPRGLEVRLPLTCAGEPEARRPQNRSQDDEAGRPTRRPAP